MLRFVFGCADVQRHYAFRCAAADRGQYLLVARAVQRCAPQCSSSLKKSRTNTHTSSDLLPFSLYFVSPLSRVCSLSFPLSPLLACTRTRDRTLSLSVMLSRALSLLPLALFLSRSLFRSLALCSSSLWVAFLSLVKLLPVSCQQVSAFFKIYLCLSICDIPPLPAIGFRSLCLSCLPSSSCRANLKQPFPRSFNRACFSSLSFFLLQSLARSLLATSTQTRAW